MSHELTRRDFLTATAVGVGTAASLKAGAAPLIPRRVLGQTGAEVSILAFGGGSRFLMFEDEEEALQVLNGVIDSGINYLDTAQAYGNGASETRYGKVLKDRRKEVFLATKLSDRKYDDAMKTIEASLQRLQTDHVDLLHIHSLEKMDDLAAIEASDGVLKALYQAREEGMARFIGMTSHSDAETMKTAIERHDLNCVQMALNAATNSGFSTAFERVALPAARKKNLGILAMKITGQETLVGNERGKAGIRDLLYYSMSLPVASCVVGMPRKEFISENIQLARDFQPLAEPEKVRIRKEVEPSVAAFNHFMMNHCDFHA
ncbi:MAG: aldo/keto reductase [Acidobacteriota bacterium]|nr:MAG: aldo/keto reductase [Acidobacteriota bacterium]